MSQPNWIGQTLGGRYEILELLGQGGMSTVYKAQDTNLRRVVAIKLIHPHLYSDPEFVRRFEEEATAVAGLRHPNIIQVHDFNQDRGTYFIVFEFVPGETLQVNLKRLNNAERLMPYNQTVEIATNIADALSYAHKQGIIHRDVKPANVMLNVHGQAILMDFGVVKIIGGDTHTATGAVLGTARYMSPEQIRSETIDTRSDIYSLGIVLFEMIGGRPPFEADSALSTMMMHVNDPIPDIWTFRPDVPEDLVVITNKALAKDAANRFQTADELSKVLREARLEPPTEDGTVIIQPAFAAAVGHQPAGAASPGVQTESQTTTQPASTEENKSNRTKVALVGGIVVAFLLLFCIAAAAITIFSGLLPFGDSNGTLATGTVVAAITETAAVEDTKSAAAVETIPATATDALIVDEPSPTDEPIIEEPSPTVTPTPTVEPTPEPPNYEGVELNVLTRDGPIIAEPLMRRGPDFEALTGAKINVITVSPGELYEQVLTDLETGANNYDAWVVSRQMMADYVTPGYVEELSDKVVGDESIQWEDVAPFFRDFSATLAGRIYSIPLDGDLHMGYYRADLLEEAGFEPPKTWDEYLQIAAFFHGQDLNGDGEPDFGSCIPTGSKYLLAIGASMLQSQGTSQGIFFDTETMEPLVDNEAIHRALDIFGESILLGPPNELNTGGLAMIGLFKSGRCALSMYWGDLGSQALDPETSVVMDKIGAMILPGSTEVLDRETGALVTCDEETCPYAIDGVNYAPFAAGVGWSGGINAAIDDTKKSAAYDFFSYISQPEQSNEDVTIGDSGFNPYRISQFVDQEAWVDAGMSPQSAASYLGAIEDSLVNPNIALDLLIPQNRRYQFTVLGSAFNQYLNGRISQDEAIQRIFDGWEEITEELGREEQLAAYRASLGHDQSSD